MKEYLLNNSKVDIYTFHEAVVAAGSSESDDVFTQDTAIEEFFKDRKTQRLQWNPNTYNEDLTRCISSGVEVIIIIKE